MDGWDVVHPFGQFRFQRILCATLLILLEKKNKGGLLKFADICVGADDVWMEWVELLTRFHQIDLAGTLKDGLGRV